MGSLHVIWIRISDPRSLRSWCIKGTDDSILGKESSVSWIHLYLNYLGSLILTQIIQRNVPLKQHSVTTNSISCEKRSAQWETRGNLCSKPFDSLIIHHPQPGTNESKIHFFICNYPVNCKANSGQCGLEWSNFGLIHLFLCHGVLHSALQNFWSFFTK